MSDLEAIVSTLLPSPLPEGGELGETPDGVPVVMHAGQPIVERDALEQSAVVVDRSWRSLLRLAGADRHRFLHGLTTCDVKSLAVGEGAYGFFTDAKGRVLADGVVLANEKALLVDLPASRAALIAEHLNKYVITDQVEVSLLPVRSILVAGSRAREECAALGLALADESRWASAEASLDGLPIGVSDERRVGVSAFTLWVEHDHAAALFERLSGSLAVSGWSVVNGARIERGIPWFGVDFSQENIPQETALESAVSFDKGCYLGQEVVARVHFLGKASRKLHRVTFSASQALPPGTPLEAAEGQELGTLTSVSVTGERDYVGIASIHRRGRRRGHRPHDRRQECRNPRDRRALTARASRVSRR